jgi:2,3-bisphosphoglycerate-dependent phosphoglycerate mutase
MYQIVLIRHGESEWNQKGLFTGWTDVDLSEKGVEEAHEAGKYLQKKGFYFDFSYSSLLKRAIKTLNVVLEETNSLWAPITRDWRMNERHYGNLQGLNKIEMAKKFGEEQVLVWRRSYDIRPPKIDDKNKFNQKGDPRYKGIKVPATESLKDVVARVIPFWEEEVKPNLKKGKKIIIAASGNSLRALVKYLDNLSEEEVLNLNIPTAIPLVYEFDKNLKPINHYYLASPKKLKEAVEKVKNQGKKK